MGTCGGEMSGAYRVLVGKPEGKWPFGVLRFRWEDDIKVNFKDIAWEGVDWVDLPRDRSCDRPSRLRFCLVSLCL